MASPTRYVLVSMTLPEANALIKAAFHPVVGVSHEELVQVVGDRVVAQSAKRAYRKLSVAAQRVEKAKAKEASCKCLRRTHEIGCRLA